MWIDAETTKLNQIHKNKSFIDKGVRYNPGSDYKSIRVHMAYAVKHDGRHKARLVAGGHLISDSSSPEIRPQTRDEIQQR